MNIPRRPIYQETYYVFYRNFALIKNVTINAYLFLHDQDVHIKMSLFAYNDTSQT